MPNISREEIIATVKECAETLGRAPRYEELRKSLPTISVRQIQKEFGSYTAALQESGVPGTGNGYEVTVHKMFLDWAGIVRKTGKIPSISEYDRKSAYSVRPLLRQFRRWKQIPKGLYTYAQQAKIDVEYADVLNIIEQHCRMSRNLNQHPNRLL